LHDGGGEIGEDTDVAVVAEDQRGFTDDVAGGVEFAGGLSDLVVTEGVVDRFGDEA